MGNSLDSFRSKFCPHTPRVVFMGESGSGRTTALFKLKLDKLVDTIPTIGFNTEQLQIGDHVFQGWDFGGSIHMRRLWSVYFDGASAIAYFIDLSRKDQEYYDESRSLLDIILKVKEVHSLPFLLVCNKKDIAELTPEEAVKLHQLERYPQVNFKVVAACSTTGEGLMEGFEWLSAEIFSNK